MKLPFEDLIQRLRGRSLGSQRDPKCSYERVSSKRARPPVSPPPQTPTSSVPAVFSDAELA